MAELVKVEKVDSKEPITNNNFFNKFIDNAKNTGKALMFIVVPFAFGGNNYYKPVPDTFIMPATKIEVPAFIENQNKIKLNDTNKLNNIVPVKTENSNNNKTEAKTLKKENETFNYCIERKIWHITSIDDTSETIDSTWWTIIINSVPITDTSYTFTHMGETHHAGITADTIPIIDSTEAYVITMRYVEGTYAQVLAMFPETYFIGSEDRDIAEYSTLYTRYINVTKDCYTYSSRLGVGFWMGNYGNQTFPMETDGTLPFGAGGEVMVSSTPFIGVGIIVANETYYLNISLNINEQNIPQELNLSSYPNPVNAVANINLGEKTNGILNVYNINGDLVDKKIVNDNSTVKLDVGDYPSGKYIINIETDDGKIANKSITVVK